MFLTAVANKSVTTLHAAVTQHSAVDLATSHEQNSKEGSYDKWTLPAVKGAIVALILGLTIVIALLVFAACQLQRMRWRSRKGRLRSGNDADYLLNGMYL
jgi:hypothetical protein